MKISTWRLVVMRLMYLVLVVGLVLDQWTSLLQRGVHWELWHGVGSSLLCAIAVMALLGLRYPLKMVPLLMFELLWKMIWLAAIALPRYLAQDFPPPIRETTINCLLGLILVPLAMPWSYVWQEYFKAPSEPWRGSKRQAH